MFITISMLIVLLFAMLLLRHSGVLKNKYYFAACIALLAAAMIIRGRLFYFESDDYLVFLQSWVDYFRENGGFSALGTYPGNYNPPYMYFLALFSYINVNDLYLIKLLSVIFDILLAWVCMKTVSLFTNNTLRLVVCFFAVLFLPTVIINSAYWAQCDVIYSFFGILSFYLALRDKPRMSMVALAASLAFKLQAVFIMPVFFILLIARKIKLRHLFIFPAAYIVFMLPAVIAGKPFMEVMTLYFSEAGTVGNALNYNAPSLTSILSSPADPNFISNLLIIEAFLFVITVFIYAIINKKKLSDAALLGFALLLAIGIPFLLPHMHDRYFFLPGMLAVVFAFVSPRYFLVPILLELASLHCYYAYFVRYYLVQPKIGGIFTLAALIMTLIFVIFSCENKNKGNFEISS